jgi:hypothetical protein
MPFPMSRTVTIALDAHCGADEVLDEIKHRLPPLGASNLRRDGHELSFGVPWTTSYGPLFIVTDGNFVVGSREEDAPMQTLSCYLSFRRAAVTIILLVYGWLGVGLSLINGEYSGGSLFGTLVLCTLGWCYLLGAWYLIVPRWLLRRLKLEEFERVTVSSAP